MPHSEPLRLRLSAALTAHNTQRLPLFRKLHAYYRNPLTLHSASRHKWYSLSQQDSLPPRINPATSPHREPVIENDIGWRIHTMVDFLFGKPISLRSAATDLPTARTIESTLDSIWERSGGTALLTHPPTAADLIDDHDHTWSDIHFVAFKELAPTDRARTHSVSYTATFRKLLPT